jgi:hypothetical protein
VTHAAARPASHSLRGRAASCCHILNRLALAAAASLTSKLQCPSAHTSSAPPSDVAEREEARVVVSSTKQLSTHGDRRKKRRLSCVHGSARAGRRGRSRRRHRSARLPPPLGEVERWQTSLVSAFWAAVEAYSEEACGPR